MTLPNRESTAWFIEQLSEGRTHPLSRQVVHLVLRRLIDERPCPICGVEAGVPCRTLGDDLSLVRTHYLRLKTMRPQRIILSNWALREWDRRERQLYAR